MKKLWVQTIGADKVVREFVFNTDDNYKLTELMIENGLQDYKILDWKLKIITFI